jgi:hypothetical protein
MGSGLNISNILNITICLFLEVRQFDGNSDIFGHFNFHEREMHVENDIRLACEAFRERPRASTFRTSGFVEVFNRRIFDMSTQKQRPSSLGVFKVFSIMLMGHE